jgi:transcription elongation factor S-II
VTHHADNDKVSMDVLEQLATWTAVPELLKATRIGIIVNDIRKNSSSSQSVKDFAKDLVLKWKKDVDALKSAGSKTAHPGAAAVNEHHKQHPPAFASISSKAEATDSNTVESARSSVTSNNEPASLQRSVSTDKIHVPSTKDKIRDKCIEMIYGALATGTDEGEYS